MKFVHQVEQPGDPLDTYLEEVVYKARLILEAKQRREAD